MMIRLALLSVAAVVLSLLVNCQAAGPRAPIAKISANDPPWGTLDTWRNPSVAPIAFRNMDRLFQTAPVSAPAACSTLYHDEQELGVSYPYRGRTYSLEAFGERTQSSAVLVMQGDRILYERYYMGADAESRFMSFSVAKSIISTLLGMLVMDGAIASLDDPVEKYLPEVMGGGYEGVSLRAVLQMSTGLRFTENYDDSSSDIYKLAAPMMSADDGTFNEIAIRPPKISAPGESFDYSSNDTQVLGMIITRVSGQSIAAFTSERLWKPIGAESEACWVTDHTGVAMAFAGFNCTLRDYGRFGMLMANDGVAGGRRLLPEGWVTEATTPQSLHVEYGRLSRTSELGYGYQWWLLPDPDGAFTAQGIYGQFVLVSPAHDLVMVQMSHWDQPWVPVLEAETYALFKAVVRVSGQ